MSGPVFPADDELVGAVLEWARNRILSGPDPMTGARPAIELDELLGSSISAAGIGGAEALRRFTDIIVPSTRAQDHPLNLAYVPAAPTPAALSFDLAVSAAEIFGGIWEAGAGAIHAENQALAWIADLAGWPEGAGGTFVQGGTIGNLSALVTARHRAAGRRAEPPRRWRIATTEGAHSSIAASARVMDVDICLVRRDPHGRMTAAGLDAAMGEADDVFAVVASAGTTNAGIIDDLAGIAGYCSDRDLWLHVDGAYGLAALAAPSARPRFAGIEAADSLVVDPHKWLFAPYDACALVYRDPAVAASAHAQRADYLDQIHLGEWNPSDFAIQLSRRARGLPLWFSLATYGTDAYAQAIEAVLATTAEIAAGLTEDPHFELLREPDLSVILFRRLGWGETRMRRWSADAARAGTILCLPTRWDHELVFRLCLVNPHTRAGDVLDALATMT